VIPPSKPLDEDRRLASLHNLCLLDTAPDEAFDRVTRLAARLFQVPIALVSLVDAERQWFKSRHGLETHETPRTVSFCGHAILGDGPFVIADALADERFHDNPLVTGDPGIRFYAGQPLRAPDGALVGVLCILDRRPRVLDSTDLDALQDLAALVEGELTLAKAVDLQREVQYREREATALFEVARQLSATLDVEQVLDIITKQTVEALRCDAAGVYRYSEARGGLVFVRGWNMDPHVTRVLVLQPGEGIGGRAYAERRPVWTRDRLSDPNLRYSTGNTGLLRAAGSHRAYLAVPIMVRGEVFGVLIAQHTQPHDHSAREVNLIANLAAQAATSIENALLYAAEATAREVAEAATRAKSQFLAGMSHELRTPLNSVIGFANVLLKNKAGTFRAPEVTYLHRIVANGTHLLGLINDILDLSKIEAGRLELSIAPVALDELVRETLAQLESQVRDRPVSLVAELPEAMAPVDTDAGKLKQVLINLIGNALKFTERGSVTVRVAVDQARRPHRIDVVDTGVGVAADQQALIFEAFRQGDNTTARRYGGTGLGLTISRALLDRMGATLALERTVGKGSTFSIVLAPAPRGDGAVADQPPRAPATPRPTATPIRVRARPARPLPASLREALVLIVNDESDSRIILSHLIRDFGCQVIAAASAEQGLQAAREHAPDLIMLDLLMPGMTGREMLATMHADPSLRDIPVIVVSIVAGELQGTIVGPVDFVDKPADRDRLLEVITSQLRPAD